MCDQPASTADVGMDAADIAHLVDGGDCGPALSPSGRSAFERSWIDRWYNTEPELLRTSLAAVPTEVLPKHRGAPLVAALVGAATPPDGRGGQAALEDLAGAEEDDEQLIQAYSAAAAQLRLEGRMSEARAYLDAARPILGRLESAIVDTTGGLASFIRLQFGVTALLSGDLVAARGWIRSTAKLRAPQRFPFLPRLTAASLALSWAVAGDATQAQACLADAAAIPRTTGWVEDLVDRSELIAKQLVAVARLDLGEAERLFQRLGASDPAMPSTYGEVWPFAALARVQFLRMRGNSEAGLELCHAMMAADLPELRGDGVAASLIPALTSACYIDLGQIRRAWETLVAVSVASPYIDLYKAKALYCMGAVEQADEIARDGLTQRWGQPWLAVEFMGIRAAADFSHGEKDAAKRTLVELSDLAEAHDLACHLGAVPRSLMAEFADVPVISRSMKRFAAVSQCTDLPEPAVRAGLTTRERAVLKLVQQGLKREEIADQLDVSVATVKSQIRTSYAKLDVRTRRQAIKKLDTVMVL